jgi:tRNA(fMet)-specific endonuclease VapC
VGVILDTSLLISAERGHSAIEAWAAHSPDEPFGLAAITVSELLHGVHRAESAARRLRREAFVEKVIELFPVIPFDVGAARVYARLWAGLAHKGVRIGAHDLLIAATAISIGYSVATADRRDYSRIPELTVQFIGEPS